MITVDHLSNALLGLGLLFVVGAVATVVASSMLLSPFHRTGLAPLFAVLSYLVVVGSVTLLVVFVLV